METKLSITTERVDDFVLLIKMMMMMQWGSASDPGSTYSAPLAAGGAGLGMGGDDLAGTHYIAFRVNSCDSWQIQGVLNGYLSGYWGPPGGK